MQYRRFLIFSIYSLLALASGDEETCSASPIEDGSIPSCHLSSSTFSFLVGVGCKPKRVKLVSKSKNSEVAKNCGEDAYYVTVIKEKVNGNEGGIQLPPWFSSIGVADGVGGWTENGVDPSKFSHGLVTHAKAYANSENASNILKPLSMLSYAFDRVVEQGDENPGGSTACFLVLNAKTGDLETANLGDSGYLIIREEEVHYRSKEQTYFFNAPYQLSLYPSWLETPQGAFLNKPSDAELTTHKLKHGDIVIVGSDGLFDNVFDTEILHETKHFLDALYKSYPEYKLKLEQHYATQDSNQKNLFEEFAHDRVLQQAIKKSMIQLSYSLTLMANSFAHDEHRESPFSKSAKAYNYRFSGGKVDDTTVVAAYVFTT